MAKQNWQTISLKPLTGILDRRSNVDESPAGSFRDKTNFAVNPDGKLARCRGFLRPFFTGLACPYKNYDFHAQGVAVADREPITLFFASQSNAGARSLFVGTKSRLHRLNEAAGSYTTIGTGFGGSGTISKTIPRFIAAELQNKVIFTNDVDKPQYHALGSATVAVIPTLETLKVTKARRTVAWNGVIFLLNTVEDGVRYSSRIRWSDLNQPIFWTPGLLNPDTSSDSIADFQDLDYGEVILNAIPLQGALYVFTDRSIWRCTFAVDTGAGTATLACTKVYTEPKNQNKCLAYANTLISTGFELYYLGRDGWYEFDPFKTEPDRPEWLHRATTILFDEAATKIDKFTCDSPVAEYRPETNELHLSWAVYDPSAIPNSGQSGAIDCSQVALPPIPGTGLNKFTLVANLKYKTADFRDYGMTAYVNFRSDVGSGGDCNQTLLFLGASGRDFTIKQMDAGYGREFYDATADTYATEGYYSLVRGLFPFERFQDEKSVKNFMADVVPENPADTALMSLKIGVADTALDPNTANGYCAVLFHTLQNKPFKCSYAKSAANYVKANVRPNLSPTLWNFLYKAKFIYFQLQIIGALGEPPVSGGCTISRFEISTKLA